MAEFWKWLGQIIVSGGFAAAFVAVFQVLAARRKVRSEATKNIADAKKSEAEAKKSEADFAQIIGSAAASVVTMLEHQVAGLKRDLDMATGRAEELKQKLGVANDRADELEQQLAAAQAETQQFRTQVDRMSKDLATAQEELARRTGEPWPRTP